MKIWKTEPAIVLGAVQALLVVGVSFGLKLSMEQTAAILAATAALLALVTRSQVSPAQKPPNGGGGGKPVHIRLDDPDETPRDGFKCAALACLLLTGCGLFGASSPDECSFDNAAYSSRVLECDHKIGQCPRNEDGTPQEDCSALVECERWLAEVCKQ